MAKQVRLNGDLAVRVEALASAERRSFANMVEVLLLAALTERGGAARTDLVSRSHAGTAGGSSGDGADLAPAKQPHVPRSVSPADVAATIPGVQVLRPHMRGDRPALECSERLPAGFGRCPSCGAVL